MQFNNFQDDPAATALFGEDLRVQDKARRMDDQERRELLAAVKDLLAEEKGKRLVWWILEQAHVFQNSFTGNSHTFFLEGERNVGLKLFALCMEAEPAFMGRLIEFKRDKETKNHGGQ